MVCLERPAIFSDVCRSLTANRGSLSRLEKAATPGAGCQESEREMALQSLETYPPINRASSVTLEVRWESVLQR